MTETYKYWETIGERIRKGHLPCMYDLYNKRDVPGGDITHDHNEPHDRTMRGNVDIRV